MCALSYFLEREGLLTTGISLVRENTASMKPPRALWVSFPLGRPLGVPGDAAFQHRVIDAALALFDREAGPVLEDFPEDAPVVESEGSAACPIAFASTLPETGTWEMALSAELGALRPWYDLARRRRKGRTLVGVSVDVPEDNVRAIGRLVDAGERPTDIKRLKHAIEDLKAFYLEAMTAQPGQHDSVAVQRRFWEETQFAAAVLLIFEDYQSSDDPGMKMIARMLAPREAVGRSTGPAGTAPLASDGDTP